MAGLNMNDIQIFRKYMYEIGDRAGEIFYKDEQLQAFIEYVDKACQLKKQQNFPRNLEFKTPDDLWDKDVEYWLNILWALCEKFATIDMIREPLAPDFQKIPMTAEGY